MTTVYEPLEAALRSMQFRQEHVPVTACAAVWLGAEPKELNFIFCADTAEEKEILADLLDGLATALRSPESQARRHAALIADRSK